MGTGGLPMLLSRGWWHSSTLGAKDFLLRTSCFPVFPTMPDAHFLHRALVWLVPCGRQDVVSGDFPGSPVAKTLLSQCRGPGFDP